MMLRVLYLTLIIEKFYEKQLGGENMKNTKSLFLLMLSIAFMFVLVACAGDGDPETTEADEETTDGGEETSSEESESGEETAEDEVIIAVPAELSSLSAHGSNDVPSGNVRNKHL